MNLAGYTIKTEIHLIKPIRNLDLADWHDLIIKLTHIRPFFDWQ